ncbi:SCO family protein [Leeia sp.]|uniref:SCO family protein n=1 Tax=Leeia sp. TaxID=2884678 RepID=UPI0035AD8AFD
MSLANNRRTLYLLALLSAVPIMAATVAYFFFKPTTVRSYGTLMQPVAPARLEGLQTVEGKALTTERFAGKWWLLTVGAAECTAPCLQQVHALRQIRLAQGKDMGRVERVWLATGTAPLASLPAMDREGLLVARGGEALLKQLQSFGAPEHAIFIMDPHGNLVFRYAPDAVPHSVIQEFAKLLKNNQGLG